MLMSVMKVKKVLKKALPCIQIWETEVQRDDAICPVLQKSSGESGV